MKTIHTPKNPYLKIKTKNKQATQKNTCHIFVPQKVPKKSFDHPYSSEHARSSEVHASTPRSCFIGNRPSETNENVAWNRGKLFEICRHICTVCWKNVAMNCVYLSETVFSRWVKEYGRVQWLHIWNMNITECFQMRKRRSTDKTQGRGNESGKLMINHHGSCAEPQTLRLYLSYKLKTFTEFLVKI